MPTYSHVEKYTLVSAEDTTGIYTADRQIPRDSLVGKTLVVTGFATSANNATVVVTGNNGTKITTDNSSSVAEEHAGVATLRTISITSSVLVCDQDTEELRRRLSLLDSTLPVVAYTAGILTITLGDGRVLQYMPGASDVNKAIVRTGPLAGTVYVLTAAGNGNGVYTGTIGAAASSLIGSIAEIAGFTTGANNGAFMVTANNGSTTLTTTNTSSATESHAGTATFTSIVASAWVLNDLKKFLDFAESVISLIKTKTATVFTVAYT